MGQSGYEAARISDIARRAGVTTIAVLARWPHKADMVVAKLEHIFAKVLLERELENLGGVEAGSFEQPALVGG